MIAQLAVALRQLLGQGLQLLAALGLLGCGGITAGQEISVEAAALHALRIAAVAEGKPAQYLKQFPCGGHRVSDSDRIGAMHGLIAEILEQSEAAHLLAGQVAENSGVHQLRQGLGGDWPFQLEIVVVDPLHQQLDRTAGVEAGGAGVAEGELLHFERLFVELRPLSSDQAVLGAHGMGGSSAEANGMQSKCITFRLDAATRNQDAAVSPLIWRINSGSDPAETRRAQPSRDTRSGAPG